MFWIKLWCFFKCMPILIFGVVFVAYILTMLIVTIKNTIKQSKCTHKNYRETQMCDAICKDCGMNLGFIGNLRDN